LILRAEECSRAGLIRTEEVVLLFRILAALILLSSFACAQTPAASGALPDPQPKSLAPLRQVTGELNDSEPGTASNLGDTAPLEKIGHGVSAPVPLSTPQAKYSREARKKKIQGPCLVKIIVDAQGLPQNPKVVRSIGYGLDEAALDAIKKYRFKPAMKDGHPVAVEMAIEVNFRLY
jgi:TonB family protein